jgi:hypothetical protein
MVFNIDWLLWVMGNRLIFVEAEKKKKFIFGLSAKEAIIYIKKNFFF